MVIGTLTGLKMLIQVNVVELVPLNEVDDAIPTT